MSPLVLRGFAAALALTGPLVTASPVVFRPGPWLHGLEWPLVLLHVLAFLGAGLVVTRRFETGVLGRALLWGLLGWSALMSIFDGGGTDAEMVLWACGVGASLLLLLLAAPLEASAGGERFRESPVRGALVAVLTLAVADTAALTFWGSLAIEAEWPRLSFFAPAAVVMGVAVYGLLQLRTWAFALNIVANLLIAGGAWLLPDLPRGFAAALTATAGLQLLAGVPVSLALARGRARSRPAWQGRAVSALVIAGATAVVIVDTIS